MSDKRLRTLYVLDILKELTNGDNGITMPRILAELENRGIGAERKAVYEDIRALCDYYGADIVMDRSGGNSDYRLLSRDFETAELRLLVDAVQSSRFITKKKSDELIRKLEHLTSIHDARSLRGQVFVTNRIKTMNETIYYNVDEINLAITDNKKITFNYFEWTPSKQKKLRHGGKRYTVSPLSLAWDNENYYLIASEDGKIKHYRVDKMQDIRMTDMPREGADNFDTALYSNKLFGMFGGKEDSVTVRFDNALAGAVIDRFGSGVMMIPDGDGFTVTVNVEISPQFFAWLCGFGQGAKITHPDHIKRDFKLFVKEILNNY